MSSTIEKEKPVALIIILVVLILIILGVVLNWNSLKNSFLNFIDSNFGEEKSQNIKTPEEKTLVADNFLAEIDNCIKTKDTDCYCPFTNTFVPEKLKFMFVNSEKFETNSFYLYGNKGDLCDYPDGSPIKSKKLAFKLYVENSLGEPSIINNKFDHTDFTEAESVFISGDSLCSSKDVLGRDSIDFINGIIYVLDKNKIEFTRNQKGLSRCKT